MVWTRGNALGIFAPAAERRMNMGCMCMECQFLRIVEDENRDFFSICANRKSENFLTELSIAFDNCEIGIIEDSCEE